MMMQSLSYWQQLSWAEASDRCVEVVSGQIVDRKNTVENYYFLITCRDSALKTYTLSYLFPKEGGVPTLIAEQQSKRSSPRPSEGGVEAEYEPEAETEAKESGVNKEQALELCQSDLGTVTSHFDDVIILDKEITAVQDKEEGFFYQLPFTTSSELGSEVRYNVNCQVSKEGIIQLEAILQRSGALTLCVDNLRLEAALLGRIKINKKAITQIDEHKPTSFAFMLPFEVKTRGAMLMPYRSVCKVDIFPELDTQIMIELENDAMFERCIERLKLKTIKMKDVVILTEEVVNLDAMEERFIGIIPFDAKDPSGKALHYKAQCRVDADGFEHLDLSARTNK